MEGSHRVTKDLFRKRPAEKNIFNEETLQLNLTQPRETFSYIPPILLGSQCEPINFQSLKGYEDAWMIRITTVEAESFYPNLLDWINNLRSIEVFFQKNWRKN